MDTRWLTFVSILLRQANLITLTREMCLDIAVVISSVKQIQLSACA